jgi:hypothetical protein
MSPEVPVVRPTILSQNHVSRAISDSRFYELLPEFRSLQVKLQTMKVNLSASGGCGGCRQRRAVSNLFNDFLTIAFALSDDGKVRLKAYLGVHQLLVNRTDPATRQVQLQTL